MRSASSSRPPCTTAGARAAARPGAAQGRATAQARVARRLTSSACSSSRGSSSTRTSSPTKEVDLVITRDALVTIRKRPPGGRPPGIRLLVARTDRSDVTRPDPLLPPQGLALRSPARVNARRSGPALGRAHGLARGVPRAVHTTSCPASVKPRIRPCISVTTAGRGGWSEPGRRWRFPASGVPSTLRVLAAVA